ncbi:MAG TPA: hypothetical protein VKV21_07925 [Solirubrobacteraceae bacterium]|nr:hypothetical protein [Solirubrobacteraceae bacterium]
MPGSEPRPEPLLTRLSRSPRALGAAAGALLIAAAVIVVVLLVSSGSSGSNPAPVKLVKVGKIVLPASDPRRQNLQTIYTPSDEILTDPVGTIREARALGFDRVKVNLAWNSVAPRPTSTRAPRFDAADPGAYPASGWAIYDEIIRLCEQYHLGVDLTLAPYVPRWAEGPGEPTPATSPATWNPNPAMFERFVQAVGTRYSGHYTPKGQKSPLPRVSFWSIWNEPNQGALGISPQAIDHNAVESSPYRYRLLADAAWTALHRTGHGGDTTLLGELAPIGNVGPKFPGQFANMVPLRFIRALYCVDSDLAPLRGRAATLRHCPATAAASRRFAAENPVLFHATAFSVHPYPYGLPPDESVPGPGGVDDAVLAQLPKLFTTLDRVQQAYGSRRRFDVYDTEYGYQTSPPDPQSGNVSPQKAAAWLNWSQYISWRLPRVLSFDQYELRDPPPLPGKKLYNRFASGVVTDTGRRKPGWYALRMPIWLPVSHQAKGGRLEVWGQVATAKDYPMAKRASAEIQFKAASGGAWRTLKTVSTRTSEGYFDTPVAFPASGSVRIRWVPPTGAAVTSRTTAVTVG